MFSKRLIELASLIPTHSTVVDVGCDHALLDIYLTINRHCKCTASDISENCLEKAKLNLKKFKLEKEIPLDLIFKDAKPEKTTPKVEPKKEEPKEEEQLSIFDDMF